MALFELGDFISWAEWGELQTARIVDTNEAFGDDAMYLVELMDGMLWPVFESEIVSVVKSGAA